MRHQNLQDNGEPDRVAPLARLALNSFSALCWTSRRVLDLLLPPRCLTCDTPADRPDGICGACWRQLQFVAPPVCAVYGTPFAHDLGEGAVSARAISDPPVYRKVRAPLVYRGPATRLVTGLKFGGRRDLAGPMAGLMAHPARTMVVAETLLVPVPLHPWRRISRRFNQSADLAKALAGRVGGIYDPFTLTRSRPTRQQVGLEAKARQANVRNAFTVNPDRLHLLHGRHVVLIDDVLTTGATVTACAKALLKAGAAEVDVLVFAMALPGDGREGSRDNDR
ncbi:ComF family protein [Roseibium sp. CAU 1637]|uniref:ComF family protein n=1 Tax=Roseibium limicola TaxID=2816037 RepID=A0A939J8R7_9HYPH|nr:ComF family protein [Roseibium limicola]MBO0347497.1 ComF family protein [Roseibium limicola]